MAAFLVTVRSSCSLSQKYAHRLRPQASGSRRKSNGVYTSFRPALNVCHRHTAPSPDNGWLTCYIVSSYGKRRRLKQNAVSFSRRRGAESFLFFYFSIFYILPGAKPLRLFLRKTALPSPDPEGAAVLPPEFSVLPHSAPPRQRSGSGRNNLPQSTGGNSFPTYY